MPGDSIRRGRQHAPPLFIDQLAESGTAHALTHIGFNRGTVQHDESWLQKLIFRFPQVIPVNEIEPGFGQLVPVCLELPTPAGIIDNLYITGNGDLVIAECKLWRNPEARREVVAQIIDYAHAMADWTFADLQDAVKKAAALNGEKPPVSLYGLVEEVGDIAEPDFVDAVSRNLRLGRMLLLIVGDGIREGVESLSSYLQLHAGFHFTLGIVEMPVFRIPNGGFVIHPRVLARTVNIERGIVRIADGQPSIEAPAAGVGTEAEGRRTSISQDRLLEMLAKIEPDLPRTLQSFVDRANEFGVVLEAATKSLQVRWRGPEDRTFALGGVSETGELWTNNVNWTPYGLGHIELAHQYLERIAALVGGELRKTSKPDQWYVAVKGTKQLPSMMALLAHQDDWLAVIEDYTEKLKAAISDAQGD